MTHTHVYIFTYICYSVFSYKVSTNLCDDQKDCIQNYRRLQDAARSGTEVYYAGLVKACVTAFIFHQYLLLLVHL